MSKKYDIFVSFKHSGTDGKPTRDSVLAREVHQYLTGLGLSVFLSNVSLESTGSAQYKKAIDDALDSAHTLVAIGTTREYLDSQWVRYEWDGFFNDILSGVKPQGRVFTLVEGLEPAQLPRALRQSQTFTNGPGTLVRLGSFIVNIGEPAAPPTLELNASSEAAPSDIPVGLPKRKRWQELAEVLGLTSSGVILPEPAEPRSVPKVTAEIAPPVMPAPSSQRDKWNALADLFGVAPKLMTNDFGMKFVLIPAGTFQMGSPADEPGRGYNEEQAEVTLTKSFFLSQTTVTQRQWTALMGTEPWNGKDDVQEGADYPATYVSWEDAQLFVKKLGETDGTDFRLPTEAEWESACRGGTTTAYTFGRDPPGEYGWFADNTAGVGRHFAHEVGQKKANPFGLFDMHGNVWEWCQDSYTDKLPGGRDPLVTVAKVHKWNTTTSEIRQNTIRVVRGGSWKDPAANFRSAYRVRSLLSNKASVIGFRVATTSSG